jgi:hypothetical protein
LFSSCFCLKHLYTFAHHAFAHYAFALHAFALLTCFLIFRSVPGNVWQLMEATLRAKFFNF